MMRVTFLFVAVCLSAAAMAAEVKATAEYPEFYSGDETKGVEFVQAIRVLEPADRAEVSGPVRVVFEAPGMEHAVARCWRWAVKKDGDDWGRDAVLGEFNLTENPKGEFEFPAQVFQSGPVVIRIQASNKAGKQDYYELQLYNASGKKWNAGLPTSDPPGAKGMKLVFADDFTSLSVSPDGRGARYAAHKTGGGDFSGRPYDLERYGNASDMWVDWVRVYCGKPLPADFGKLKEYGIPGTVAVDFTNADEQPMSFGWNDGQYAEGSNLVIFRNLSSPAVTLKMENTGDQGAPAVAGLQIVPSSDF